jgi:hypothetical protein
LLENDKGIFNKLEDGIFKLVTHVFKLRRANPDNQEDAGYETMVNKATYRNFLKCRNGEAAWNTEAVTKTSGIERAQKHPGSRISPPCGCQVRFNTDRASTRAIRRRTGRGDLRNREVLHETVVCNNDGFR